MTTDDQSALDSQVVKLLKKFTKCPKLDEFNWKVIMDFDTYDEGLCQFSYEVILKQIKLKPIKERFEFVEKCILNIA